MKGAVISDGAVFRLRLCTKNYVYIYIYQSARLSGVAGCSRLVSTWFG